MASTNITVYTTDPCSFCARAKALLEQRGLEYDEVNLARTRRAARGSSQRTGMMTLPPDRRRRRVVGGFAELVQADRSGRRAGRARLAAGARGVALAAALTARVAAARGWQRSQT